MMFMANPCGPKVIEAMQAGVIGYIDTPLQGNKRPEGVLYCCDNGCFSDKWDAEKWWQFLLDNAHDTKTCLFAVAPDVVADADATIERSGPWLQPIRDLGYRVAFVAQDGLMCWRGDLVTDGFLSAIAWKAFDCLFIGGSTEWKLGAHARVIATEAKRRGKWVHMGRVNSERRFEYARAIGCDSCDGTYLTFGPDTNLPKLLAWTRNNQQGVLFGGPR